VSGVHWVTGRGIKINRAATAWLIRRFIDPEATFVFVKPAEVAETARTLGGVGFHAPGTAYPARDERGLTPFEALVAERCAGDEVLREMSAIVRQADRPEPGAAAEAVPEAAGLRLITGAFPLVAQDDMETVERSAFLYDAMYAGLAARRRRDGHD
jgi:hypothetical protein